MNFLKKIFIKEKYFILISPVLVWQFLFLYFPLAALIFYSFLDFSVAGKFFSFTFCSYRNLLNFIYLKIIWDSFLLAFFTSLVCLIIAYPVAYFLALRVKKLKTFMLFTLILPSWTSFIVQVYAWFFLLQKRGFLNFILCKLGIISSSSHLLNNYFSILLGMIYCFLPFMILPVYAILEKMDKSLIEASADLGASQIETFKRIVLPLTLPGIVVGFFLVFIPAFGEFAIPDLLGGCKTVFWGNVIVDKFLMTRDWQSGSAITVLGMLFLIFMFILSYLCGIVFKKILKKLK